MDGVVPGKVGVKIVLFKSDRLLYRLCKITAPYFSSPEINGRKIKFVFFTAAAAGFRSPRGYY